MAKESVAQINRTAVKIMKENICANDGGARLFSHQDINLASLTPEEQKELLKLHNHQELEVIKQQLLRGVDCSVQHYDYEEDDMEYEREEDYLEQEESEEEECYEDMSSNEQDYQFDELSNSERIQSGKTSLVEFFTLLNRQEIASEDAQECLSVLYPKQRIAVNESQKRHLHEQVSIWIREISKDLDYLFKRAHLPLRERSYSETDLLQRKKEECQEHADDFTVNQQRFIRIIEKIVHYLTQCFEEMHKIYNSPIIFKRIRDFLAEDRRHTPDPATAVRESKRSDKRLRQILCSLETFKYNLSSFPQKTHLVEQNRYYYSRQDGART